MSFSPALKRSLSHRGDNPSSLAIEVCEKAGQAHPILVGQTCHKTRVKSLMHVLYIIYFCVAWLYVQRRWTLYAAGQS